MYVCIHAHICDFGIGTVSTQNQRFDDSERFYAYLSRFLTEGEKNYSTMENECIAVL